MSDLVGNPEDRFSHSEAHMKPRKVKVSMYIPFVLPEPALFVHMEYGGEESDKPQVLVM